MDTIAWNEIAIPFLVIICLLCVLLMMILLIVEIVNRSKISRYLRQMETHTQNTLEDMEDDLQQQYGAQREEVLQSLYQMNESLTNTFGGMQRSQNEHVQALIRQNYENTQAADQRQQHMQQIISEQMRALEERTADLEKRTVDSLRQMEESIQLFRRQNSDSIAEIRATVDEKLQSALDKKLSESFSQVSERLEQVYRSLGEVHSLASGVGDLKRMLGNVKTRGTWGEVQLGRLLEEVFTENQYRKNTVIVPGSAERVEYAICLPGKENEGTVLLPIDSKFPQENYLRLAEVAQCGEAAEVEAARRALLASVRKEAKRIGKYIVPPHSTDFAVMFLPMEGLYAEVSRDAETLDSIQRDYRVLIAGPSTLLALLNSLQMGFRTLAIEKRSAEVWRLLGAVKHDFSLFAQNLQKTQERLRQVSDQIDTTFAQTQRIEKHLAKVEVLESDDQRKEPFLLDASADE